MARQFFGGYSDTIKLYNSANLVLPEANEQIAEELHLYTENGFYYLHNWHKTFFVPTKINYTIERKTAQIIVQYRFKLNNALFLSLLIAFITAILLYDRLSVIWGWIIVLAILLFVVLMSIQNSFIRKTIQQALCLPCFEGDAELCCKQMTNMNNIDNCPACGELRGNTTICQNCGIKLPPK